MPRETFTQWLARRFGVTLKQVATDLKSELPGLGDTIIEDELELADNTTGNASATKHGFLKKLSNVASEVLDGQGAFRTIAAILGYTPADAATLTSHTGDTANPHSVTKTQVGLGNVDDTSDASKPVSTAQQTALDLKQNSLGFTALNANGSNAALPTSDPAVAGRLWSDAGTVKVSAGA
jgi:hypothetical protein